MDESKLVEGCRRGDREAQQELYVQTSPQVYSLILRMTGRREDAFDLTQETYIRAFAKISQFDGRSSLATWLYRIAVNEVRQFLRKAATERTTIQALQDRAARPSPPPGDVGLDVDAALATLPPTDRMILILRYEHGRDYRTIAEACDITIGTVASRLNRARARVREWLESAYASDVDGKTRSGDGRLPSGRADL